MMKASSKLYDVVVIGGGINGVGIAADAAGRGLSVLLCEQNDLASATSSNSSKLIHGGLRYLENFEFRLVKEALAEREVLLKNAPHLITPLTFYLPHQAHLRPAWIIRLGLLIYDNLAKRVTLPASKSITFDKDSPLNANITKGFSYSDAWVDDSRLVILNAMQAKKSGADIFPRTRCVAAKRQQHWQVTLACQQTGQLTTVQAKAVVNAAGPWVAKLFGDVLPFTSPQSIRLVRGSHIVVPRIHQQPQAYILQNEDQRIVFVLPFEDDYSLIGTTDVDYQGDPGQVKISEQEIDYLINITNRYFKRPIYRDDVIHTFSGVRPLIDEEVESAQKVSRDYRFEVDAPKLENGLQAGVLLSVFGGKITTYRKLSEAAVNLLTPYFPSLGQSNTINKDLPGGEFSSPVDLLVQFKSQYPEIPQPLLKRWVRCYGILALNFVGAATTTAQLGQDFGHGLYAAEVDYLIDNEWAMDASDVLWRRTKLGLRLDAMQVQALQNYMMSKAGKLMDCSESNNLALNITKSA